MFHCLQKTWAYLSIKLPWVFVNCAKSNRESGLSELPPNQSPWKHTRSHRSIAASASERERACCGQARRGGGGGGRGGGGEVFCSVAQESFRGRTQREREERPILILGHFEQCLFVWRYKSLTFLSGVGKTSVTARYRLTDNKRGGVIVAERSPWNAEGTMVKRWLPFFSFLHA